MNTSKIVNFLFEIATLRRLTRSHRQMIQEVSDNISDHSFRVAIIGMILAEMEKADSNKVLKMCLFHDIPEARTGDANAINQHYLDIHETEALGDQMKDLPIEKEVIKLFKEYSDRKTKEAIVAKDADTLDQMVLEQEYFYKDAENRMVWQDHMQVRLKTKSAKILASEIRKSNPHEWLYNMMEHKTGKKIRR